MSSKIRIHQSGGGKVTDTNLEKKLRLDNPYTLLTAQNLLSATAKHLKNQGWFSSKSSRLQRVQKLTYKLRDELKKQNLNQSLHDIEIVVNYLSIISDTYPNWQPEYQELNRLLPHFFAYNVS